MHNKCKIFVYKDNNLITKHTFPKKNAGTRAKIISSAVITETRSLVEIVPEIR